MKILTIIFSILSVSLTEAKWGVDGNNLPSLRKTLSLHEESSQIKALVLNEKREPDRSLLSGGGMKPKEVVDMDKKVGRRVLLGDVGNVLTVGLSVYLLYKTLGVLERLETLEWRSCFNEKGPPTVCNLPDDFGSTILDPCYVCDSFCTFDRYDSMTNSHMLSLYVDIAMTIALLMFRKNHKKRLKELNLDAYLLSGMKVFGVLGHGCAHLLISYISHKGTGEKGTTKKSSPLKSIFGYTTQTNEVEARETAEKQVNFLRKTVLPFLGPIGFAQALVSRGNEDNSDLIGNTGFGAVAFLFFLAGVPDLKNFQNILLALVSAIVLTVVSVRSLPPGAEEAFGAGFVLIFTSAYVFSGAYQVFLWDKDEKEKSATAYVATAWTSNLLTTLVGWLLALKCTMMLPLGGHVWYDFSIPASYFIMFWVTSKLSG